MHFNQWGILYWSQKEGVCTVMCLMFCAARICSIKFMNNNIVNDSDFLGILFRLVTKREIEQLHYYVVILLKANALAWSSQMATKIHPV